MKDSNKGFDYAYVYPGMIKVLQAAGRCHNKRAFKDIR